MTVQSPPDTLLERSTSEKKAQPSTVFINWPIQGEEVNSIDLLDGTDFSQCKLAFFNPLEFAYARGFLSPDDDISEVSYASFQEKDFLSYLSKVKKAREMLVRFLDNGGVLVIRANIPKSHIKVRKKSTAGLRRYTESIVSSFFWLEEIIGVYLLTYRLSRALKYVVPTSPLTRQFGETAVESLQGLNSVGKGKLEKIALSSPASDAAAIARITFKDSPGQVFLIPRFRVRPEHTKLVETFQKIILNVKSETPRPRWLEQHQRQVRDFSPFGPIINEVERQQEALKKQLAELESKQNQYDKLTDLLFENEEELHSATRTALEILGFDTGKPPRNGTPKAFEVQAEDDPSIRLMVRVAASESGSIGYEDIEILDDAIKARRSRVKAKGVLIGNAFRTVRPDQRREWFDDETVEESKRRDFCLLPTLELFTIACYMMSRLGSENISDLRRSLWRDILQSDSVFVLNRKKYSI